MKSSLFKITTLIELIAIREEKTALQLQYEKASPTAT
jgi:hypothetical protein